MAKRKAADDGEEQHAPKRRAAAKLRRDAAVSQPASQEKTDVATGSHEMRARHGNGQDPAEQPVEKLAPSTTDGADEAEGRDDHESSVHDQSGQNAARKQVAASASDKDEHRRNCGADPQPDPTSAAASDAAPAAVTGSDAGGVGNTCPQSPRPSSQQSLVQSKSSEAHQGSTQSLASRDGAEADEATTTTARLRTKQDGEGAAAAEAEARNDEPEKQTSRMRREVEIPTPAAGPKATTGARGRGGWHPPPAPVRRVSPLALPQVPKTIPPTQPGVSAAAPTSLSSAAEPSTEGKVSTSAKASPPAKALPSAKASPPASPARAPSPAKASTPAPAPSALIPKSPRSPPCSGPQSRHPPLPSPAARTPIPASRTDDLEPFTWDDFVMAAGAYQFLEQLEASQFILMADLNSFHDRLPILLTREGLQAAPARARRFRSGVVHTYNKFLRSPPTAPFLSVERMQETLEAAKKKLDELWKAGRRATNEPKWMGGKNGGYAVV